MKKAVLILHLCSHPSYSSAMIHVLSYNEIIGIMDSILVENENHISGRQCQLTEGMFCLDWFIGC